MTIHQVEDANAVLSKVRELVVDALGLDIDPKTIPTNASLFDVYGLDSLGAVMVFVNLSMEYGIPEPPPEENLKYIDTVQKFTDYVMERLQ
jgi:acyl carrier protein